MKKQSDRIKDWREKQKADGKTSFTVMLSQEARSILLAEKEKTGESYAGIIERALLNMKKQGYRRPSVKYYPNREETAPRISTEHQQPVIPRMIPENGVQPKILIDDFNNYPSIRDIEREQTEKKKNGLHDLNVKKGLFRRLFRS